MSDSYSLTGTETFTIADARRIASKVATDLSRFRRFYNSPSPEMINQYEEELTLLLKEDYLANVTYGFKRNGKWLEAALRYHALPGGTLIADDDPGKVPHNVDVSGAKFGSYLIQNERWRNLSAAVREHFEAKLPFRRDGALEPVLERGVWSQGNVYSAGGRGLARSTIIR